MFLRAFESERLPTFVKNGKSGVIECLELKGEPLTEIKPELDSVYGDTAPLFLTVKTWDAGFKCGKMSILEKECSGRSKTVTKDEIIYYVHEFII